jgi:hypothetical protein
MSSSIYSKETIELRIDWRGFRIWSFLIGGAWTGLVVALLVPSVRTWLDVKVAKPFAGALFVTAAGVFFFLKMAWPYWQASRLTFTPAGILRRNSSSAGDFVPWGEVTEVRLIDYGRGGRDILIRAGDRKLKIDIVAFQNPYLLSRLIRDHVRLADTSKLPLTGEV